MRSSIAVFLLVSIFVAGNASAATVPSFTRNASVHDPSVIKVGDRFYVFGSHGASAWTEDLMNWTQVASGMQAGKVHFLNWRTTLSALVEWTNADTLWAADVFQLDDGKYYYYYNVWTNYLNYRSYMGLAVSDTIEGPYTDVGELLRGGTNVSGFDPAFDPNTIDPTLYRDANDALWMVYGSYSGGIFVLEMDDTTGFQKPGQEWGTKVLDGRFGSIEGPFMEYNADTGFFYLFLSYGGLAAADGYQMRVFRSESPNGPFFDPQGTNMSTASSVSWTQYGLKLAGGWQFTPVTGEVAQTVTGYLAPGHNSVIKDPASGKWFNIFHTRFVNRGEAHEIRVHQLFFNEDGWPVMAPHRYAGETQGSYTSAGIAGSYKVINHGKDVTREAIPKTSTVIGLNANGNVDSSSGGSWTMLDDQNIRITMGSVTYKGVVCEQWDNENKLWVNTFTAISDDGTALWGSEVAVLDRTGDLVAPELVQHENTAISGGEPYELQLENLTDPTDLYLLYELTEAPAGMTINTDTGLIKWTPLSSQEGTINQVRARLYDTVDPSLSDTVEFSIYVGKKTAIIGVNNLFTQEGTGGIKDASGTFTGLTSRLSGTGTATPENDPNLSLDTSAGSLSIKTTPTDFNNQAGVSLTSAVGHKLSEFGYTGDENFTVFAEFGPISTLENIDQIGVFVGNSATTLTRAGIIILDQNAQGYGVHTQAGVDTDVTFNASGFDLSDGVTVSLARVAGVWSYIVDGVVVNPTAPNATFLDSMDDLTVGVFGIHSPDNSTTKTVEAESFSVSVSSDLPAVTRMDEWKTTHFGENPSLGVAGDGDDPDLDGRSNLIEYALGTNPMLYDVSENDNVWLEGDMLHWSFDREDDPALIFKVSRSEGLGGGDSQLIWTSAGASNLLGPADVQEALPGSEDEKVFLQLAVETVE